MARALQLYLQRQGFSEMLIVEPVLLCSNASIHVDSLRPIIRVVMRDALERFAVSVLQSRVVMDPQAAQDIVDRILKVPSPVAAQEALQSGPAAVSAPAAAFSASTGEQESGLPDFVEELAATPSEALPTPAFLQSESDPIQTWGLEATPLRPSPFAGTQDSTQPNAAVASRRPDPSRRPRRRSAFNRKQWTLLIVIFAFWLLLMILLAFMVARDLIL